jgi:hypothetical protein
VGPPKDAWRNEEEDDTVRYPPGEPQRFPKKKATNFQMFHTLLFRLLVVCPPNIRPSFHVQIFHDSSAITCL